MLRILRKQLPSRLRPAPYTYDTLPSNEQDPYIRLLALIPSRNQSSRLKGSLQHFRLNEVDGGYEAVSYEWGSPSPGNLTAGGRRSIPRTIVIDGKSLRITDNLFQCLLQLRSGGNLFLWIDAICINQTNGEERTSQVAIMGRIYSCALRTLSWLGRPVDFDDRISMDDSRAEAVLDFYRREAGRLRASSHECESSRPNLQTECQKVAIAQLSEGFSGVEICIIEKFFGLSYFTRRWVVQEIALAREVQLIWGASRLAWDDFILVATRVDLSDKECIGPLVHTYINGEKPCPRRSNVLWLMRTFERTECGDPIDRIAALQGLWRGPKNISRLFPVDYNESVESNYIRFAKLLVHLRLFGELLLCAVLGTGSTTVPSWVPDWRHQRFWDDRPDNVYDQWEPALPLSLGSEDTLLSSMDC